MARTGRPRKPTRLKLLQGTLEKSRENPDEPQPELAAPAPPEELSGEALVEWNRIVPELEALCILTRFDRAALAAYCWRWAAVVELEVFLAENGRTTETADGRPVPAPEVKMLDSAYAQLHKFLTEFGLSPASRARVRAGKPKGKKEADPWKELKGRG